MITYGYTILYVEDVEATLAFYVKAFGFTQKFITPEKDYSELETGGTTLAFALYSVAEFNGIAIEKRKPEASPSPFEITFVSDDIESAWKQAVEAGAEIVKEPAQIPGVKPSATSATSMVFWSKYVRKLIQNNRMTKQGRKKLK
ncbi:MAG: VOC family protein [Minisyncoccia bacterium]